jgi:drug/metabolite transporter (DMT)-like permease
MQNPDRPLIPPLLAIPFGILAVSTASIFIRFIQAEAVHSLVIAALRLTLASAILAPVAIKRHHDELLALNRREISLALLSGTFLAIHFATWISSLEYTSVASSVIFVSTAPLWVAILAPLTLKEPVSRIVLIGMGIALAGGIFVGLSDSCTFQVDPTRGSPVAKLICPPLAEFLGGDAFFGDILALSGAIAGAGYILIGRRLRENMSLITYIFVVYGMAAVLLVIVMFGAGESPLGHPSQAYLWVLLLALVPQLLGHSTFNWALRYLSAAYVSITLLGEPIGSAILAYFILGEVPSGLMVFGAILILVGIFIASYRDRRTRPKAGLT